MIIRYIKALALGLSIFPGMVILVLTGTVTLLGEGSLNIHPWLGLFVPNTVILVASLACMKLSSKKWKDFGFQIPITFSWLTLFILSIMVASFGCAIINLMTSESMNLLERLNFVQVLFFVWIYASVSEEIFCRGLLLSLVLPTPKKQVTHALAPILFSAFFFSGMHLIVKTSGVSWFYTILIMTFSLSCGLVASYYRVKTKSIVPSIVVHALFNISGYIFYKLF